MLQSFKYFITWLCSNKLVLGVLQATTENRGPQDPQRGGTRSASPWTQHLLPSQPVGSVQATHTANKSQFRVQSRTPPRPSPSPGQHARPAEPGEMPPHAPTGGKLSQSCDLSLPHREGGGIGKIDRERPVHKRCPATVLWISQATEGCGSTPWRDRGSGGYLRFNYWGTIV